MNIVGGGVFFSIEHTEVSGSFKKKIDRGKANEEELGGLMNQIIHKPNTQNQNTFKSRLNGQPQLTIIQVAKAINKESLTMTDRSLWTAFLKSLDQQLLLTEQLMLQNL
jgi:hypothetical protein